MIPEFQAVERRGKPRIETRVRVKFIGLGAPAESFTGNLSKSGIFLETREPLVETGRKVNLQLTLASSPEPIRVSGMVTRTVGPNLVGAVAGLGIEFLRVETRNAKAFERLIDRLLDARGIGCRRHPRAQNQVTVEFRGIRGPGRAVTDNLSKGGMFIRTSTDGFAIGDSLNIVILHPTAKRRFSVDASVVHIRKGQVRGVREFVEGVGVQFAEFSPTRGNDLLLFLRSVISAKKRKQIAG